MGFNDIKYDFPVCHEGHNGNEGPVGPGQLGKIMGDIRRALSVTIVRANAMCLLERLSQLGPGAGAAAKRRQVALRLEERRRQDRQAHDLAWQARGASRVGRAFVQ